MSRQLIKIFSQGHGFRNDGVADFDSSVYATEILDFEYKHLGNIDILHTMYDQGYIDNPTYEEARQFLVDYEEVIGSKLYALWLCASKQDVINNYPDDYNSLKPSVEDLSAYYVLGLTSTRFILSDLGEQGVLIAQGKPFRKTLKVR